MSGICKNCGNEEWTHFMGVTDYENGCKGYESW